MSSTVWSCHRAYLQCVLLFGTPKASASYLQHLHSPLPPLLGCEGPRLEHFSVNDDLDNDFIAPTYSGSHSECRNSPPRVEYLPSNGEYQKARAASSLIGIDTFRQVMDIFPGLLSNKEVRLPEDLVYG